MKNRDKQIVKKILEEINVAEAMIGTYDLDYFLSNEMAKRAACMTLINIGELSKNLTEQFRNDNNHIPWRAIAGMRDITAHKYQTLKMTDVWVTLTEDIPRLKLQLTEICVI